MGLIRRICGEDKETLDLLDKTLQNPTCIHAVDIINGMEERPTGTSAEQALRRLRKSRPDLHARVLAHEISARRLPGFRQAFADGSIRHNIITIIRRSIVDAIGTVDATGSALPGSGQDVHGRKRSPDRLQKV